MSDSTTKSPAFQTSAERGIERFGYSPDGGCKEALGLTDRCLAAFRANRSAVNAARHQQFDGDWGVTRQALRAVALFTGLYFTRGR